MNTVEQYVDSDGDARTSVQNVKYTLVKSVPGQCAVFVYESEPGSTFQARPIPGRRAGCAMVTVRPLTRGAPGPLVC
jgi:hypothetical protein